MTDSVNSATRGPAEYLSNSALMSFAPINRIHQHLVGLHCYAVDRTRAVPSHHFCSCAPTDGVRQCVIYDSDKPDAKLIGVEYVITEALFLTLPDEEKQYWHSHKFEVESGMLQLGSKALVPTAAEDLAEKTVMAELHSTYGKTIHTWAVDDSKCSKIPLGPPFLMKSLQPEDRLDPSLVADYKKIAGSSLEHKQQQRAEYLDLAYIVKPGGEVGWGIDFQPKGVAVNTGLVQWKGEKSLKEYHQS